MTSISIKTPDYSPEIENFDFSQKGCHIKRHLKSSRMAQISVT